MKKKWAKSVQLVRVSFFLSDFLQNPYCSEIGVLEDVWFYVYLQYKGVKGAATRFS